jgi:MFS family permease
VRLAVSASFFVSGAVVSSWVPHIPGMQRALGLSPAALGLVLLAPAVGALVAMFVSGGISMRIGTAMLMRTATVFYCLMLPLTVAAPHPVLLGVVLAMMGLGNGAIGVAMNAESVEVERAYQRGIISSFHALYSLGCLVGASVGGLVIALGVSPLVHLTVVALLVGLVGVASSFRYLPARIAPVTEKTPLLVRPTRFLAILGLGTFCSMLAEGAIADWAGLYMRDALGTSAGLAATGYAAYSLMMVLGRVAGDASTRALGSAGIVRWGGAVAAFGIVLALAVRHPVAAVVGFGLVGTGLANVVPNFFSASGRETAMPSARAIAAVSSVGFAGFLAGPPIIGAIAQLTSLPFAMGAVAVACVLIAVSAGALKPREASHA